MDASIYDGVHKSQYVVYIHIRFLAFNANGSPWLINRMRREREWPVTCEQWSWSDRGWKGRKKKACVIDRCGEEEEEEEGKKRIDGAGRGERCKYCARDVLPSLTGVITLPYSPVPAGWRAVFQSGGTGGAVYLPHFIVSVPIFIRPSILIAPLMVPLHSSHQP